MATLPFASRAADVRAFVGAAQHHYRLLSIIAEWLRDPSLSGADIVEAATALLHDAGFDVVPKQEKEAEQ